MRGDCFVTPMRNRQKSKDCDMNQMPIRTKIVATLGPASSSREKIENLILAGASVFRINFSHGDRESHAATIESVRKVSRKLEVPVAVLADLQGPKIRTGKTPGDLPIELRKGNRVELAAGKGESNEKVIHVGYPPLVDEVGVGKDILINDGAIRLKVVKKDKPRGRLICSVQNTGEYSSGKGVNFPDIELSLPALTAKDRKDLAFALTQEIDYIALSFVRHAEDLKPLHRAVKKSGKPVGIIAKIEKPEGVRNAEAILSTVDGIMVARGDLGVETSAQDVPVYQKRLIDGANHKGKLVIVATQMLESMIKSPRPTRAEASDVANAIFDGTDAVMLSGETAVGQYPIRAVTMMTDIAATAENSEYYPRDPVDLSLREYYPPDAICEAARWAATDLGGAPIVVFTRSGNTAFYLSKLRNFSPIYAFTPEPATARAVSLAWNVRALEYGIQKDVVELIAGAENILLKRQLVRPGDLVVFVGGTLPVTGATNFLRIKPIGAE